MSLDIYKNRIDSNWQCFIKINDNDRSIRIRALPGCDRRDFEALIRRSTIHYPYYAKHNIRIRGKFDLVVKAVNILKLRGVRI
jgi:hypothetical protein